MRVTAVPSGEGSAWIKVASWWSSERRRDSSTSRLMRMIIRAARGLGGLGVLLVLVSAFELSRWRGGCCSGGGLGGGWV